MSKRKTTPRGRDSATGRFIPVSQARRRPKTTTVDQIRNSGGRRKRTR